MTDIGYEKAQSGNLPKIDVITMSSFIASNPDYNSAEMKGVKAERCKRESYGDSAVGYVQVKRDGDICTVKARITPEHNVRKKAYTVIVTCNEAEETVLSAQCEDCAAHKGGCKHALAFLAWLHRRSEEPPSTSIECYWKKSKLSSVGTSLKFIKAKDICDTPKKQPKLVSTQSQESFLSIVVNYSKKVGNTDNQLMKYFTEPSNCEKLSIHYLVSTIPNKPKTPEEFIDFCKVKMHTLVCQEAALATVDQSDCPLWHELRYARVTASKAYEAANCKKIDGTLTEAILGSKLKSTEPMKRGKLLESAVITVVEKIKNIKIKKCGLILSPLNPIMGASPDGESNEYSIEIKCPASKKTFINYITKANEISAKCMAQIQLQMHFSNKTKGLFCVAHSDFEESKNVTILEVDYNKELCENLLKNAHYIGAMQFFPCCLKKLNNH